MFAKLKKKIEEEEGVPEGDLKRSTSQAGRTTGRRESLRRAGESTSSLNSWGSTSSLTGASPASATPKQNDVSAKKEKLQAEITKKDETIRKLESKLDEYSLLLKEAVRDKEKSQLLSDKHQEEAARRVQEINEEFQVRRAKMADKLSLAIQKKENELHDKMVALESENADLQQKLKKAEMQTFMKREDNDELQGFQIQELAKVKHMFVNSQEELHKCKADLDHTREKLEEKTRQLSTAEIDLQSAQTSLSSITKERDDFLKEKTEQSNLIRKLGKEKAALEEAMNNISKESQESKKGSADQESELGHLREKVVTLEQRLLDNDLSQDDHVKAIQSERDNLEQKLEETRKELTADKTESSEKITSLEKQIEHLNTKISDDTEEHRSSLSRAESAQSQLRSEISDLKSMLEAAQKETSSLQREAMVKEAQLKAQKEVNESELTMAHQQLTQVKRQFMESKKQLQDKVAALEAKVIAVETARDFDKSASEHKQARLDSVNEDFLEKEIEHEKQVSCLEEELDRLKKSISSADSKMNQLQTELEGANARATEAQTQSQDTESLISRQKEQLSILHATVKEKEQHIKKHESEHQSLQQTNESLSQRLEELERSHKVSHDEAQKLIFEKTETISVLQQSLSENGEELALITQKLQELEAKLTQVEAEAQARIEQTEMNGHMELQNQERLRQTVESLEQQLIDKNKTIKMQQQRLSDLKKTLQRELKVQTIAGYESPEEALRNNDTQLDKNKLSIPDNNFHGSNSSLTQSTVFTDQDGSLARSDLREINFQYLRHVVFTFMSSTDYEAKQLLKAVSTVLELTPKEEGMIRKTLDWKTSWFGPKPAMKKLVQVGSPGSGMR
ncbi:golgin subfamily A member 1 isoform X2 [Strongylocentrotus purpuratus]|uniref:GRIP domain-containing protein n=1 Tax=Strongylocentrotus purpuratus TaxID=7668 RepID=A0A7M7GFF4_STRPU|nr:golgin subfamily A member 1 isoform X2 [Strongylocentrotus purpuratus]